MARISSVGLLLLLVVCLVVLTEARRGGSRPRGQQRPRTRGRACFTELGCPHDSCCVRDILDGDDGPAFAQKGRCRSATDIQDTTQFTVSIVTEDLVDLLDPGVTLNALADDQDFLGVCRRGTLVNSSTKRKRRQAETASVDQILNVVLAPQTFVASEVVAPETRSPLQKIRQQAQDAEHVMSELLQQLEAVEA
eukprot:scpid90637/ scgid30869/ 